MLFAESDGGGSVFGILVILALMVYGLKKAVGSTPPEVKEALKGTVVDRINKWRK